MYILIPFDFLMLFDYQVYAVFYVGDRTEYYILSFSCLLQVYAVFYVGDRRDAKWDILNGNNNSNGGGNNLSDLSSSEYDWDWDWKKKERSTDEIPHPLKFENSISSL